MFLQNMEVGGEEEGRKERRKAKEETSRDKGKPA